MSERIGWRGFVRQLRQEMPHWPATLPEMPRLLHRYLEERSSADSGPQLAALAAEQRRLARWLTLVSALIARMARENGESAPGVVCRGVLLSRKQYRIDTETWGLRDARLDSDVAMTPEDIVEWTLADPARPGPDA